MTHEPKDKSFQATITREAHKGLKEGTGLLVKYIVKYGLVAIFLVFVGWYAISIVKSSVMSPITAISSWFGEKKAEVGATVESGRQKATEALESGKETVGKVKDFGTSALEKVKDLVPGGEEETTPSSPESAPPSDATTTTEESCTFDWVPFVECKKAQ